MMKGTAVKVMTATDAAMTTVPPLLIVVEAAGTPARAAGVVRATVAPHYSPILRALAALAAGKGLPLEAGHRYSLASPIVPGK